MIRLGLEGKENVYCRTQRKIPSPNHDLIPMLHGAITRVGCRGRQLFSFCSGHFLMLFLSCTLSHDSSINVYVSTNMYLS